MSHAAFLPLFWRAWIFMALFMFGLWAWQLRTKVANAVDVGWASGFAFVALLNAPVASGYPLRRHLVAFMICVWSFRLGSYLLVNRVLKHKEEDSRYKKLREHWGQKEFFVFYQAQALLTALLSIPMLIALTNAEPSLRIWDWLGMIIWALAIFGETTADAQLAAHRGNPAMKGKTCRTGLWRYSRHPNYFCEWLHWWAYVVIGFSAPWGALTLLGPALMFWFLFKVTGIPPTEAQSLKSRPDYAEYQRTTSMFFPWFPKKVK